MYKDKIRVKFIDIGQEPTTICWPTSNYEYVEQLLYDILESLNVGPVCRLLFALRSTEGDCLWFAPNVRVADLFKLCNKSTTIPNLELRIRFRPSSFTKLIALDRVAFEFIFAQIRYDFLNTKFSKEKPNFILLNDSVLGLVATDLLRHSLEHNIDINDICKRVARKDFIPHYAALWQKPLLFLLKENLKIQQQIQIGYRNCEKDVLKIKQGFVELFLYEVAKDYCSETYRVCCVDNPQSPQPMLIRVRYTQNSEDSTCEIESRVRQKGISSGNVTWTKLCDIYSICYGTLRENAVELNRSNGRPFRVVFESIFHAKSFLSLIDGYYRLMRKWYFNFCRDVSSPDLLHLKQIRSHGPIGFESMRRKLTKLKKPGTFLIRRCMDKTNRYILDVILPSNVRLAIDIEWNLKRKVYTKISHSLRTAKCATVTIKLDADEYPTIKALVNDMQISVDSPDVGCSLLQLKHWLPPGEYDDCPALLLSLPKKKFVDYDSKTENKIQSSISELPRFIPSHIIKMSNKPLCRSHNKMIVKLASLNGQQNVIVKEHLEDINTANNEVIEKNQLILNFCYDNQKQPKFFKQLMPAQIRLADWVFVKNPLFADMFGIDLSRNSLIQEYFPLGPLDRFLSKSSKVTEMTRRSIARQLGHALLFLQEKRIVHGKLRCHNIYIKNEDPIQIKITDPLGVIDIERDNAFIPPEYQGIHGEFYLGEYESGIDVWATGTTLWQIYSQGCKPPPNRYANTLLQPSDCPDHIWSLIEACWIVEPANRASPQAIFRDLNDYFVWVVDEHAYDYISTYTNDTNGSYDDCASSISSKTMNNSNSTEHRAIKRESSTSENSSSGGGSQMNLLKSSIPLPDYKIAEMKKLVNNHSTLSLKNPIVRGWKSIKLFKNNSTYTNTEVGDQEYTNLSNRSSVSICSSPYKKEDSQILEKMIDYECPSDLANHSDWRIDSKKLKLGQEIGRGSCGVVIKGVLSQWGGLDEQVVAVKCINNYEVEDLSRVDDLKREFDILSKLDHPNIVKTLGFVDDMNLKLVVEYMPLGSLLSCLRNSHHDHLLSLPLEKYARDIAEGMKYLESMKIVHRDLALRNILAKNLNEVKICDFGLAQFLGSNNHYKLKTDRALPIRWYAPEVLETWKFTHKTDVWSYGVVLWEIYSGGSSPHYPGTYNGLTEVLKHERLPMPRHCSPFIYNIMLSCWAYEPEERESFVSLCDRLDCLPGKSAHMLQDTTHDVTLSLDSCWDINTEQVAR